MKKYDCSKTLDYAHEFKRMCVGRSCRGDHCPFLGKSCSPDSITDEHIQILQKWSDEHPEPLKLTKKDRTFLESFRGAVDRKIRKDPNGYAYYYFEGVSSGLSGDMFKALEPKTTMTFAELMELEVEDE